MDIFYVQNGVKQNVLLPLHFNVALEYATRKVQENQMGFKLNKTTLVLVYIRVLIQK
jgi:hypothetical protein